ncbi:hypothetical protein BLA13014_07577 [Burkholderia aenigmatica]|uniref:Uncharacterized protein n=1 Tax=Burkholderia aenigmatica TaxID=2015348 RepID=A0A6P2SJF4_9BURK|nr:hypothetical protein [Burkholderia aenigmatica]VWC49276.1 hypothetical protein BLA13014_07577 [Burkholderia aenigmatica]
MAQLQVRRTTTQRVTYLNRPATCCEYLLQSSATGLRVVTRQFDGDTDVEVRLIYGDGRTPQFREYLTAKVASGLGDATVADFVAQAAEQHARKKPGVH